MSVVVVKIKKKSNTSLVKKFVATLNEEANVLSDEEYLDSMFSKLLQTGRKSKLLSEADSKKELTKHGIKV
jgi:hypothetical protein